ncbi:MAG: hypothetical protein WD359_01120 [Dehalococcoidia bacterium]
MPDPESIARASLIRSLLIYGAFLIADVLVIVWVVSNGIEGPAYVTTSIVAVVGLLLLYQVVQHVRDLRAPLVESEGIVTRKWKNADLIIAWDSYYIRVERVVFRIKPEYFIDVREESYVKVVHFPYSLNVVSVHELRPPAPGTR